MFRHMLSDLAIVDEFEMCMSGKFVQQLSIGWRSLLPKFCMYLPTTTACSPTVKGPNGTMAVTRPVIGAPIALTKLSLNKALSFSKSTSFRSTISRSLKWSSQNLLTIFSPWFVASIQIVLEQSSFCLLRRLT